MERKADPTDVAADELRRSTWYLAQAQRVAHIGYWDRDLDAGWLTLSEESCHIFGLPPQRHVELSQWHERWLRLIHPDDRPKVAEAAAAALRGGPPYDVEYRVIRPAGDTRVVRSRAEVTWDDAGRPRRMFGVMQDITDLRRAEQALREMSERFRAMAESSIVGIYLVQDGLLRYVNPALARMFGYAVDEIVDRFGPLELVHPDDRPRVGGELDRRFEGGGDEARYEFRGRRSDGSEFPVEVHGRRIDLAGRPAIMGALLDNTERRRAERELRRSQSYLAEAQRISRTGSFGWDPSRGAITWSEETYRIFGLDPATPPSIALVDARTHPDDRAAVQAAIQRAEREGSGFDLEHRVLLPDGTVKHLHVVARALADELGRREFAGAVMDVTEQKRAEEERRLHVWFLEGMDRVNRAIQGTDDLEQMVRDVLDAARAIFQCHRAALVTDSGLAEPTSFVVVASRAQPGFEGVLAAGAEYPIDEDVAGMLRISRSASAPVPFTPDTDPPLPPRLAERFRSPSFLAMPVYAKVDAREGFHHFLLSHCSPRDWAPHEMRLFHEIARRLGDALRTLSMLRELRWSEARLEEAQRIAHVGHWEWKLEDDGFTCSGEAAAILDLPPEGRPTSLAAVLARCHPEDGPRARREFEAVRAGAAGLGLELRVVHAGGDARFVHVRGSAIADAAGRPSRVFGTIQDVTERTRAEGELRTSQDRFRTLFDFAADAFMIHDEGGAVIDANRQACESLGYSREELIGKRLGEFDAAFDAAMFGRVRDRVLAGETVTFETSHRRKDGTVFPVEIRARLVPDADRMLAISLSRDVTERKRAEEERERLRQAEADLARISRVTTMGEFTASLAHEIRQPVAAAITNAKTCIRWLAREQPDLEEARAAAARIVADANRVADIVSRVRALYKNDAPRHEPVDVNEVVRETLVLLRSEASRRGVAIQAELAPDLPAAMGDRVQLQQVLVNLIVNGLEAMGGEPGVVRIASARGCEGEVLVSVTDDGVGLPDGASERIFDAFFTTKPQGTGLGLAISRSIVERHGGQLWATPARPRGTSFHLSLPPVGADE